MSAHVNDITLHITAKNMDVTPVKHCFNIQKTDHMMGTLNFTF
jgi:hypothetical protein